MIVQAIALLLSALLLAILQQSAQASDIVCQWSCAIKHPQHQFCDADTAFRLRVTGMSFIDVDFQETTHYASTAMQFHSVVITPLKGAFWAEEGMELNFYTPRWTCAIPTPKIDEEYLIAGKVRNGVLNVTLCDGLAIQWSKLTAEQLAGVQGEYVKRCGTCTIDSARAIKYSGGELARLGMESGYWTTEKCFFNPIPSQRYGGEDCESLYSICKAGLGGNGAECGWEKTSSYEKCATNREDEWFFKEKAETAFNCQSDCRAQSTKQLRYKCKKALKKYINQGLC